MGVGPSSAERAVGRRSRPCAKGHGSSISLGRLRLTGSDRTATIAGSTLGCDALSEERNATPQVSDQTHAHLEARPHQEHSGPLRAEDASEEDGGKAYGQRRYADDGFPAGPRREEGRREEGGGESAEVAAGFGGESGRGYGQEVGAPCGAAWQPGATRRDKAEKSIRGTPTTTTILPTD